MKKQRSAAANKTPKIWVSKNDSVRKKITFQRGQIGNVESSHVSLPKYKDDYADHC